MLRLLLARHGETEWNAQSQMDVPFSAFSNG
jgi:broad specificity phosphatase PhoE